VVSGPGPRLAAVWGMVLLAVRLLVPSITFGTAGGRVSVGEAHALCSSAVGVWAQAVSSSAAADCGRVALVYDGLDLVVAGVIGCAAVVVIGVLNGRP
jgi:hypothetical protein